MVESIVRVEMASYLLPNETQTMWQAKWKLHLPVINITSTVSPHEDQSHQLEVTVPTEVPIATDETATQIEQYSTLRHPVLNRDSDNPSSATTAISKADHPHRYVIEWLHWEQMTMAINSLVQLAWFTASWNAQTVEPFTQNGYFHGLIDRAHTCLSMSTIFNMSKFNDMLVRHSIPPLVKFSEFVKHGSKSILVIHIFFGDNDAKAFSTVKANRSAVIDLFRKENSSVVQCHEEPYLKVIGNQLTHTMNYALKPKQGPYKVVKYCCINGLEVTSRDIVRDKCGISDLKEDHTIVVTDWRGISSKLNFRLFLPEFESANIPRDIIYPYSRKVEKNALDFLRSFANNKSVLFIHFRSEKLATMEPTIEDYFDQCVRKSLEIKESILSRNRSGAYVVACFTDVSKHGSRSCRRRSCPGRMLMNVAVTKYKLNTISYDPRKFHGMLDSTFVAAVEQEAMSMADVLILVGGGSFQSQLRLRYMSNHNRQSSGLYQICN